MIADRVLESLKELSPGFLDAYVVVDGDQAIIDFNRVFYSLFPRSVARRLKRITLKDAIQLELAGHPLELAEDCMKNGSSLRYDEVIGYPEGGERINLIAAATPLRGPDGEVSGAFISLRNVTDEAQVQQKYRSMLDDEARERETLQKRILRAEAELVEVKDQLNGVEKELRDYKKGLLV